MPKLFIYPKKGEFFTFSLKEKQISIGRIVENDITLADPFCSVYHAFIYPSELGYIIQDNASKNGSFVNGNRIRSETILKKGDEILIGSTRIIFDQELKIDVEVTKVESPWANVITTTPLKKILEKPDISETLKADLTSSNLERIKSERKVYLILSEVSKALISNEPLTHLLEHIMDLICQNLPMDRGILMLIEGNPAQLIPKVVRINNENLKNQKIKVSQSIINMVFKNNAAVLTYDAQADTRFKTKESIIEADIHSAMCVPLWNNKEIIGIVYSDRIYLLDRFTNEDLKLLTLLSNVAAVKIENAKLFEEAIEKEKIEKELDLAAQIQKDFLPKENIKYENFEICGFNIPCYQVGGDYYDFIDIDPNRLGIIIADVSGKGISASLLMASLRAALHSEVHPQYKLEDILFKLNNFIHRSSAINTYITFLFCELNKKTGELRYINAGHNPPLIYDNKGEVHYMESCGFCLGMFPSVKYKEKSIFLKPNDIALFFTDGIIECQDKEKKKFDEERLINLLQTHSHLSADEIKEKIINEIESFTTGSDQIDDMTLVIIKRIS